MRKNKNIVIGHRLAVLDMDILRHAASDARKRQDVCCASLLMAFAAVMLLLVLFCALRIGIVQEAQAEGLESAAAILTDVRVRLDVLEDGLRRAEQRRAAEASGPVFESATTTEALFARPQ
jgi:hypothetical protein